jgi:hypothetical protein
MPSTRSLWGVTHAGPRAGLAADDVTIAVYLRSSRCWGRRSDQ